MISPENKPHRLRNALETLAEGIITVAGITVIAALFAMLILIVREAAPLFMPAARHETGTASLPAGIRPDDVVALGVESDLRNRSRTAGIILADGRCGFATLPGEGGGEMEFSKLAGTTGGRIRRIECRAGGLYSVLWDNNILALFAMRTAFREDADGRMRSTAAFERIVEVPLDPGLGAPICAMLRGDEKSHRAVAAYPDGTIVEKSLRPGRGLLARGQGVGSERKARATWRGEVVSTALNGDGRRLYLGTDGGDIVSVDLSGDADEEIAWDTTPAFPDARPVTSMAFLNGGYALAVGDAAGEVSIWFPRRENGEFRLRRSVGWDGTGSAVRAIAASGRDRGFLALDSGGKMRWLYSTNGRDLLDVSPDGSRPAALAANARFDALLTLEGDGTLRFHRLDGFHPEAGWRGFFGRLLYEGYEEPAFVWQSTGSDASEPKLSLVPLIWGSVKAAAYALIFATPIALAAAVYLSQFTAPAWRARLKPAVEMMAAVPSVVIGFLAALWLAPLLERYAAFFAGGHPYDQRNSLVIAIAMGFAVTPTIFSLAEDAVSAVPPSLSAASLALGASRWQTVRRVVIPSASPGIFTAVMLGFGRAVGETMIVLMAAGNTPIISLSPFDGMRTLSANIAVEMPEAPVGGTLYRTLFLCAFILFVLTLIINTAAELFRHRLRRRYGRL
ncbi:MAG: phosphate ABC transporter permease subunit PstC [Planctomycetota bacterium]|jgi:phosphate transport system permease protein|nr:phosphate ABC transporter permease subunit PstC [Planctomycetota bacterium]